MMATRVLDLLHVSVEEQADAAAMAKIEADAERDGLRIVRASEGHAARQARESSASAAVRTVSVTDPRAYLRNLAAIARGDVRVVD